MNTDYINMIKANHTTWARLIFDVYVQRLLKRHFHACRLLGDIPNPDPELPLMVLPNHSSWWDGFLMYMVNLKIFKRPFYLMMLERELSKYRFFSRLGAYSINSHNPKSTMRSLGYTVEMLNSSDNPAPLICIFPQGELKPWGKRPLGYKRGIDWIIKDYDKDVNILPLAIRCEYLDEQRAEMFFLFGEKYIVNSGNFPGMRGLEEAEEFLLEDLSLRILYGEKGRPLLSGSRSVNRKLDSFLGSGNLGRRTMVKKK